MASNKALKGLNAIRLNKKDFHNQGAFAINNFNCVFNSLLPLRNMAPPNLKNELKKKLISILARAIKTCMYYPDRMISFKNVHKMNNRAMPDAIMSYKCAIQLFKLYNYNEMSIDWVNLNFNQNIYN